MALTETMPIRKDLVFYEAYSGNGMLCHPEAIFQQLLKEPDMAHLEHVWVLKDFDRYASTIEIYRDNPKVKFVKYLSIEYYRALRTAKYLVNNVSFPQQFSKRDGQIYLETWHGVPLKKMGYDVAGKASDAKNIVRNFFAADFLLSAGERMTEQMYLGAFKLNNIFKGAIIEEGNPRIDRQFLGASGAAELKTWFERLGLGWDDREVILYAPTWKGASYAKPDTDATALQAVVEYLSSKVDSKKYRVLLKAHQVVSDRIARIPAMKDFLVPNEVPTNLVLGATSLLVTDYSSIFYDFLATGKPVAFYVPDLETYRTYRDVYTEPEDHPGELARSLSELWTVISESLESRMMAEGVRARYDRDTENHCRRDDGAASSRIIDIVFRGIEEGYQVKRDFTDGRESVLIYVGGMASNGITTSALNLLDNIDYERFDVSVLFPHSRDADKVRNTRSINSNARILVRDGTFNGGHFANRGRLMGQAQGWDGRRKHEPKVEAIWKDEWNRCFGDAEFDYIADFCGYSPFWDYLFLQGKAKRHSVWLHNDLAADADREVEGQKTLKSGLRAVFTTYEKFGALVSVSAPLSEINRESLAEYVSKDKFVSCRNSINVEKINLLAKGDLDTPEESLIIENGEIQIGKSSSVVDAVDRLSKLFSLASIRREIGRRQHLNKFFDTTSEVKTFVAVGRLSPEKNHERLVQAFELVQETHPDTRLVIIGNGPLRGDLDALISSLGLDHVVTMAGQQENPYLIMANSDCFVMSSDYEGQPMVILEALTLGLPVVTTAFGSVRAALPEGEGLVVEQTVSALANGMRSFLNGEVTSNHFDASEYNRAVMNEFYAAIGSEYRVSEPADHAIGMKSFIRAEDVAVVQN
ncbi:glycosyltransferase [Paeniglutamicibacter cryotolerans]